MGGYQTSRVQGVLVQCWQPSEEGLVLGWWFMVQGWVWLPGPDTYVVSLWSFLCSQGGHSSNKRFLRVGRQKTVQS